ncbi:hypothetical protein CGZ94_13285 [Enemella evansiae]|uniref:Uncharacterized protein n=1 Tax=Enemella evansiae TaxID=2016499 RepID=A0A255GAC0_9ACTN|nr:hypothetical protein [Enemella evansiae]OYO12859.1 hypothetical protein CGZ94_13285 [Enemella evansiae]
MRRDSDDLDVHVEDFDADAYSAAAQRDEGLLDIFEPLGASFDDSTLSDDDDGDGDLADIGSGTHPIG